MSGPHPPPLLPEQLLVGKGVKSEEAQIPGELLVCKSF